MEDVGIYYGHLVHFTVFCYILWTFGIVHCNLVYFFPVLVFCTETNLATLALSATLASHRPITSDPGSSRSDSLVFIRTTCCNNDMAQRQQQQP
jgi:hypothetical protein